MDNLFPEAMMDETVTPYGIGRPQQYAQLIGRFCHPDSGHASDHSFTNPLKAPVFGSTGSLYWGVSGSCECGKCEECEVTLNYLSFHKRL